MPARNHEPSIWDLAAASRKRYPALSGDLETDVCVVGAGITGLTAALLLRKAGRRVVVVEKEQIGAGTTGGTSAHLTNVVDFRYSSLAGSMICNLIQQGHDAYEDLYHPGRVRLTGASDFIRKNIQVTRDFIADRLLQPSSRYVDRLAKGEGCVIRDGSSYVAVYRDTGGNLRTYSAICPRTSWALRWNDNERPRACPRQRPRFDTDGQLVEGPATMQLEPVSWSPSKKP